jgi:hypothetical protein
VDSDNAAIKSSQLEWLNRSINCGYTILTNRAFDAKWEEECLAIPRI